MGDDSAGFADDIQRGTAAMWNLFIFEIVDAVTVVSAAWLIARALSGGSGVTLAVPARLEPIELLDDRDSLPPLLDDPAGPDGVEWPSSTWRPSLAVPILHGAD
jgi:hypothetical protein